MTITPATRRRIIARDGLRCRICNGAINDARQADVDHIKPKSKSGSDEDANVQVTHKRCNRRKQANEEFTYHSKTKPLFRGKRKLQSRPLRRKAK